MTGRKASTILEMSDLCTPWCLHVVSTLRIADYIASGIERIEDLAVAAECDPGVLHSVLGHLVSKGVFQEPEAGRFMMNDTAGGLLDPAVRLGLDLNGIGGRMAYAWGSLIKYVHTGSPAYHEVFGLPFWADMDEYPEIGASFDALMGPLGHGNPDPKFQITGGWEPVKTVVDVGGGTGALLAEILRMRPNIHGTLLDLPKTVARAAGTFHRAGVSDRVTLVGQSFFDPLPAGADLYLLKSVVHDWPDREAIAILKRCADAARPNGRVIVLKSVSPDGASKTLTVSMVLVGGKDRTIAEFRELARQSGLDVLAVAPQTSGQLVVECRPV